MKKTARLFFSYSKSKANFRAFRWNISSSTNLFFPKSVSLSIYIGLCVPPVQMNDAYVRLTERMFGDDGDYKDQPIPVEVYMV